MHLPFFLARRFVAGRDFDEAAPKVKALNQKRIAVTLDMLGENLTDREMADATTLGYCELLEGIRDEQLDATISVKLTMLGLDIDTEYCRSNLFTLLDKARELDQFVRIDMEGSNYTQRTIDIYNQAGKEYGRHVGVVIQAYLYRSRDDIAALIGDNADVRLCKGAYKEPASLAYQNMAEIRAVFKQLASDLIKSTDYTRIATHDDHLIEWTKQFAAENDIPKDKYEFQLLYGLRQSTCEALAQDGYNVRIYIPYGTMWFPYFSRRLRERKENIWFILSNMFRK